MELTAFIDGYCERTGPGYWSEPVNALTNAAFLVAAWIAWRRTRRGDGAAMALPRALTFVLAAIGVGSYLFHTHARVWAAIADTTPIAVFILLYIYAANRHFWRLRRLPALALTALYFPYTAALVPLFSALPGFAISAPYWPVPLLIAGYAVALSRRSPQVARGLGIGAAVLVASLAFRSADAALCPVVPLGTHFLWHLLNAAMLGWMIEVLHRHIDAGEVATAPGGR